MTRGSVALGVGRVGPVVEQRAEVDQRVAERRHVPVEHRRHPVRVGRVATGSCRASGRCAAPTPAGSRAAWPSASRRVTSVIAGMRPASTRSQRFDQPATWRPTNPCRLAEVAEPDGVGIEQVQVGQRVDDGEPHAPAGVGMVGHRRRDVAPDADAAAVLDDDEVGADHRVVVAEGVRLRRPVEVRRRGRPAPCTRGFMSWAPGAILPNGGRRTTSGVSPIQTR